MKIPRRVTTETAEHLRELLSATGDEVGLIIDERYEIQRRIARGGMGEIFYARDLRLNRPVALKVLSVSGPQWSERFKAEVQAMTQVEHPGIAPIHDLGLFPNGRTYYTMKYVSGLTLHEMLARQVPLARLLTVLASAGDIVQHAHEQGVIHRDLKPANIMVDENDNVFVLDWGVARLLDEIRQVQPQGTVVGTIEYMPPEQARGEATGIDERSDVYALGAILYEFLTGRPPVDGVTRGEMLERAAAGAPLPPRRLAPSVSAELEAICMKALRPRPDLRYPTAAAFVDDLRKYQAGEPVSAHPAKVTYRFRKKLSKHRGLVLAAAIGLGLALIAGGALGRRAQRQREESLRELWGLWHNVVLAKEEWYQAQKDPKKTRGKIEAAMVGLDRFVETNPEAPQGYYVRARGRLYLDDLPAARKDLEESIRRDPAFAPGWALLGRVKLEQYQRLMWGDRESRSLLLRRAKPQLDEVKEAFRKAAQTNRADGSNWGVDELDEEHVVKTVAQVYAAQYGEQRSEARRMLEETHRRSPREEYCNLLGLWTSKPEQNERWQTEALRIRPHYAKAYFDRAAARESLGDFAGMIDDNTRGLEICPTFFQGYLNRAVGRMKLKDFAGALEDASKALALEPGYAKAWLVRAAIRSDLKDFAGARDEATKALALEPRSSQALVTRATAALALDDLSNAILDASGAISLNSGSASAYVVRAAAKGRLKDFAGSVEDASQALKIDPGSPEALLTRADARWNLGDAKGTIQDATDAISINPKLPAAYLRRALARGTTKDAVGAIEDATEALRLEARSADALLVRAAARGETGDPAGGLEDATEALKLVPDSCEARVTRASLRMRLQDYPGVIEDTTKGIASNPRHAPAHVYRAKARIQSGDASGALADASEAIRLAPRTADALVVRAVVRIETGDPAGGLVDAEEALSLDPNSAEGYVARASARLQLGDPRRAIEDAAKALAMNTRFPVAFLLRSKARSATGDVPGAIEDASKALELVPGSAAAYETRTEAKVRGGLFQDALEDCTKVLEIDAHRESMYSCRGLILEQLARRESGQARTYLLRAESDFLKALSIGREKGPRREVSLNGLNRVRAALSRAEQR